MKEKDIIRLRHWFADYVGGFRSDDPYIEKNYHLKEHHSRRVCGFCMAIARSLELPPEKLHMAEAVGLFHDIGRFEQFEKYRTYSDKISENHAELGARVLEREKVFDFLSSTLKAVLIKGVRYHNRKDLPEGEDEETLFYAKLVRDADKLDILRILSEYYHSDERGSNPALDLDLPEDPEIAPAVVDDIMNRRCVNMANIKTAHDFRLLQTSWVFDFNFKYTRDFVREHGYMEEIMKVLPQREEVKRVCDYLLGFLSKDGHA